MKPAKVGAGEYDARIRRAEYLAGQHPFAAEILRLYSQIAKFQKSFYLEAAKDLAQPPRGHSPSSLRDASYFLDAANTVPKLTSFLSLVEQAGPPPLAAAARDIAHLETNSKRSLLESYWELAGRNDQLIGPFAQFIPRAFLQPLAELTAAAQSAAPALSTQHTCPLCGGQPMLGVLRQEGDGGKRLMLCSFCLHEWDFRRIYCPHCAESDEKKLPVYVAEQFPHLRVEACDTCKTCIRTIDLTKDGNAVPLVDDLAALPLTLWAQQHNYTRLHPNLLGT